MRLIKGLITAGIALALLAVPAGALAKRSDRDHDRMPDKWEKRHHLNPHANDARKDPDHDGLSNLSEFRHHTDPQVADSDDDGMNDGQEVRDDTNPNHDDDQEVSGAVVSFENGVLTIQPPGDGTSPVSGTVNDSTRIECDSENENESNDDAPATQPTAGAASDGSGDGGGDRSGSGDGTSGSGTSGSGDSGSGSGSDDGSGHESGDDNSTTTPAPAGDDDANEHSCSSADLKPGAQVHEAKFLTATDGSTVFTKIELVPAA